MQSLVAYFGCGKYYKQTNKYFGRFVCEDVQSILNKIIPFFNEHKIMGIKALGFQDWCGIADFVKSKAHLTNEGLSLIQDIKEGMNRSRREE